MKLYFLRHAIAAERGDPKYPDDSLRPLTTQGQQKMREAAQGMHASGLTFDAILSSPYVRAKQTAEIVAQIYKNKKIHFTKNLLPPASVGELLKEINAHFPKSKNVLVVGHEPHLTTMISCLLNSPQSLAINFKKGALCSLSIEGPSDYANAQLNWLLTATQLGLLGLKE